jgi:Domain of unknown function (DUF4386)
VRGLQITAGITFVGAWIVGLILAADGPKPDDSATKVAHYFATHEHKAFVAHFLIDGLAGLAIIAMAVAISQYLGRDSGLAQAVLWAGIAAGIASLAQMVVGEILTYRAAHGSSADNVKTLFKVLNNGDTVKICLLAIMIGAASILARRTGAFPRWFATAGIIFAPLLAISGFAFPFNSDALYASLEVTLIALLLWVIGVTIIVARSGARPEPVHGTGAPSY